MVKQYADLKQKRIYTAPEAKTRVNGEDEAEEQAAESDKIAISGFSRSFRGDRAPLPTRRVRIRVPNQAHATSRRLHHADTRPTGLLHHPFAVGVFPAMSIGRVESKLTSVAALRLAEVPDMPLLTTRSQSRLCAAWRCRQPGQHVSH